MNVLAFWVFIGLMIVAIIGVISSPFTKYLNRRKYTLIDHMLHHGPMTYPDAEQHLTDEGMAPAKVEPYIRRLSERGLLTWPTDPAHEPFTLTAPPKGLRHRRPFR